MSKDYHKILGVSSSASDSEIKKSYRKLAMKYHPDRNQGNKEAEKQFKEVTEAYEVLTGQRKPDNSGFDGGGGDPFSSFTGSSGFGDFGDIFNDIFGGRTASGGTNRRSHAERGSDVRYNLDLTLEEAFSGTKKIVAFTIASTCKSCKGNGSEGKSDLDSCSKCNGNGKVQYQQGFFFLEKTCDKCSGTGKIISNPCKTCKGEGRFAQQKKISVDIPAGVDNESKIPVKGEGEGGLRGGSSGDLYVCIAIKKHKFFTRRKHDIHIEVPIKITTAALGGFIEIPSIEKKYTRLFIPEGTQSNNQLKLKSQGMTILNSGGRRGDMYAKIFVETPIKLNKKEKSLLEELDKSISNKSNPQSESFFKKISKIFG